MIDFSLVIDPYPRTMTREIYRHVRSNERKMNRYVRLCIESPAFAQRFEQACIDLMQDGYSATRISVDAKNRLQVNQTKDIWDLGDECPTI